ncbi:MAG: YlbF family regulator [Lachnospiraceae bacterium]|nr:YlbF family regulator [Lachnospiraceae bacterium]
MAGVDAALNGLIAAILDSPQYQEYEKQLAVMKERPELKQKIDEFRHENYILHRSAEGDELFYKMDEFNKRYEDFRKNPHVDSFLEAELEFCRMIQNINQEIVEAVNFE